MESIWGGISQFSANASSVYILLLIGGFLSRLVPNFFSFFYDYAAAQVYTNVEITDTEEAFEWIMQYLLDNRSFSSRNLLLYVQHGDDDSSPTKKVQNNSAYSGTKSKKTCKLSYYPGPGRHLLWHKDQPILMTFSRSPPNPLRSNSKPDDKLTLSSFRRNVIEDLLLRSLEHQCEKEKGKTLVFTFAENYQRWTKVVSKKRKPLQSIVLDEALVKNVIGDIDEFLGSKDWYVRLGIPHHRTYLLYGNPGCGKTSFVSALSGHLGMNLCILTLSSKQMNDRNLAFALQDTPDNSIILLEDIDAAFQSRTATEANAPMAKSTEITFSGFLNAIDGVASPDGKLFIMTTNHIEKLDPALIRPGRVDKRIEFKLANKNQIENLFIKFYGEEERDLAVKFATHIPEETVSMATLQEHFVTHKKSPIDAYNTWKNIIEPVTK